MNLKKNISLLATAHNISISNLEKELGFSNGSIAKWDKRMPSIDKVIKVANFFNVSVDSLINNDFKNFHYEITYKGQKPKTDLNAIQSPLDDILDTQNVKIFDSDGNDITNRGLLDSKMDSLLNSVEHFQKFVHQSVYLDDSLFKKVENLAIKNERSVDNQVAYMLKKYLKDQ